MGALHKSMEPFSVAMLKSEKYSLAYTESLGRVVVQQL